MKRPAVLTLVAMAGFGLGAFVVPAAPASAQTPTTAELCAFVYADYNDNGVHDADEPGLSDLWVSLRLGVDPYTSLTGALTNGGGAACFDVDPAFGPFKLELLAECVTPPSHYPIPVVAGERVVRDFRNTCLEKPTPPTTEPPVTTAPPTTAPPTTAPEAPTTSTPAPTTTAAGVTPTTVPATTVPAPTTTATVLAATTLPAPQPTTAAPGGTLPRTGSDGVLATVALGMIIAGSGLVALRRRFG